MQRDRADEILMYIGANVLRLRVQRKMTQDELAAAAGVSGGFLQRVERGKTNIGIRMLVYIADALEVTPATLLRPATMPEAKLGRPRKTPQK